MNSFSAHSLVAPYRLIGFTALSLLIMTTRLTPASIAALMTFSAPITLVWIASNGLYSQDGICLSAAAWNTTSTPCMARSSRAWSRTSPTKKRSAASLKRAIISDCFNSSRLNTTSRRGRYRPSIVSTNLFPNEPVPPVTSTEASLQSSVPSLPLAFTLCLRVVWRLWSAISHCLDLRELEPVEPGVGLVARQEFGVAAHGLHRSAVHDHDFVRVEYGGQAVSDHDRCRSLDHPVDGLLHQALGLAVERTGGLVEDQDLWVRDDRAGDGDTLALAARQANPPVADHRVVPVGERHDEVVGVPDLRGADDGRLRDLVPAVRDVLPDRGVEQERLLRDDAEKPPIGRLLERPQIPPVDGNRTLQRVIEAEDEVRERRLACAARPDQRHDLALLDLEAHAAQDGLAAVVERHVAEDDAIAELRDRPYTIRQRGCDAEQLIDSTRRREGRVHRRVRGAEHRELRHRRTPHVQEQEEGRSAEAARQELPGREEQQRRLDDIVDDHPRRLRHVLEDTELDVDVNDALQNLAEAGELEALGAEGFDHSDAEDGLLEPRSQIGERRELIDCEFTDGTADEAAQAVVEEHRSHGGTHEHRTRADHEIRIERDQQRCRQDGSDDRLESCRGCVRVRLEPRHQLTGPLSVEKAHGEAEEMAKQIALERCGGAHADPESEEIIAEVGDPLENPDRKVGQAQNDDGAESVVNRTNSDPVEERRAKVRQRESVVRGGAAHPSADGDAEGEVEDRRHQNGKEGGQRRPNVARQQEQPDGPPVGRRVVPEQPEEPPNVARARHARLGFGSGSASGRRSVRSFSCGIPSRMSSARYGSGRSSVATMTPSTCSSGRRLTARTGRPRKTPPASRAKTPRGSSPSSFSVTYASSAASPTP